MEDWKLTDDDLPRDSAGFLRRACPACRRNFKYPGTITMPAEPQCPYCGLIDGEASWWTDAQLTYAHDHIFAILTELAAKLPRW